MAFEFPGQVISLEAAEDLSSDQYRFVVQDATTGKVRRPDAVGEIPLGVLQNAPSAAGQAASVMISGVSKVRANAALAIGAIVGAEYVGAADAGKACDASLSGEQQAAAGIVMLAAGAEDDIATVRLFGPSPQRTQVAVPLTLTANTTVVSTYMATRACRLKAAYIGCFAIPVDADGTALLTITKGAATNVLAAANFDLEAITAAKTAQALALSATPASLVLAAGDVIQFACVNNSAAIDTAAQGLSITLDIDLL